MYSQAQRRYIWLSESLGSGSKAMERAMPVTGDANEVWEEPERFLPFMTPGQYQRLMENRSEAWIDDRVRQMEKAGVRAVCQMDEDFPDPLRFIPNPPALIYARGQLPGPGGHVIGVVGTRRPSRDGLRTARDIARGLAESGVWVVSGMAKGIDAAAHEGSLAGKGPTLAVLGTGIDQCYPPENRAIYDQIPQAGGALVSEYPLGTPVYAANFVRRNRLISGFASGTLLVEGAEKSGAMITLRDAAQQGRARFAVPGSIYQINSAAPNALIQDGARLVTSAEDILGYFGWGKRAEKAAPEARQTRMDLTGEEAEVARALEVEELSFSEIAQKTGQEAGPLATLLTMMEIKGIITALPGNMYRITR